MNKFIHREGAVRVAQTQAWRASVLLSFCSSSSSSSFAFAETAEIGTASAASKAGLFMLLLATCSREVHCGVQLGIALYVDYLQFAASSFSLFAVAVFATTPFLSLNYRPALQAHQMEVCRVDWHCLMQMDILNLLVPLVRNYEAVNHLCLVRVQTQILPPLPSCS